MGMMADLLIKMGFDPSMFDKGIDATKAKVTGLDKVVQSMGNRMVSSFMAMFSVNMAIRYTSELMKQVSEIDSLGRKFNMTSNEVQILMKLSERLHTPFEQLAKDAATIRDNLEVASKLNLRPTLSPEQIKTLNEARMQLEIAGEARDIGSAKALQEVMKRLPDKDKSWKQNLSDILTLKAERFIPVVAESIDWLRGKRKPAKKTEEDIASEKRREQDARDDVRREEEKWQNENLAKMEKDYLKQYNEETGDMWDEWMKLGDQLNKGDKEQYELNQKFLDAIDNVKLKAGDSLEQVGNFLGADPEFQQQMNLANIADEVSKIRAKLETGDKKVTASPFPDGL